MKAFGMVSSRNEFECAILLMVLYLMCDFAVRAVQSRQEIAEVRKCARFCFRVKLSRLCTIMIDDILADFDFMATRIHYEDSRSNRNIKPDECNTVVPSITRTVSPI